jgi:uncharacterized protein (TIGR00251 family)
LEKQSGCTFEVHLKPRAKRDGIVMGESGVLEISVTSPPVDDRANEHLVKLLSKRLSIPRSSIRIIKGGHSRNKVVALDGLTDTEVKNRIAV